jgi:hypothetical protein
MTARLAARPESPWFTLAWFVVVLVVVFTTAFWVGRIAGPEVDEPVGDPPAHEMSPG